MDNYLNSGVLFRFPGISFTLDYWEESFEILGLSISVSGILLAIALILGLFVTEHLAKKTEQNTEFYIDLAIRVVIAGVIGARIGYVCGHLDDFLSDRANVLQISDGGMSFSGALVAGMLISVIYCYQKKISWLLVCDTALPGILLGQMICSASLYEMAEFFVMLIALIVLCRYKKMDGIPLGCYLILYGMQSFCQQLIQQTVSKSQSETFSAEYMIAVVLIMFGAVVLGKQVKKYRITQKERPKNFVLKKKSK